MSNKLSNVIDGMYSAFNFSGNHTFVKRRSKKAKVFSSSVSTDTKVNFRKSIGAVASSIKTEVSLHNV